MKVELNLRNKVAAQAVELQEAKDDTKLLLLAARMLLASMDRTEIDRRESVACARQIVEKIERNRSL